MASTPALDRPVVAPLKGGGDLGVDDVLHQAIGQGALQPIADLSEHGAILDEDEEHRADCRV